MLRKDWISEWALISMHKYAFWVIKLFFKVKLLLRKTHCHQYLTKNVAYQMFSILSNGVKLLSKKLSTVF